jgi:hypothetical protein
MFHYQRVLQPSATFVAEIWDIWLHVAMDQYQLIPFLVGWTSIYQLFWCSPGVQGFDTLPYESYWVCKRDPIRPTSETSDEPNIRWRWRRRHWKILFRWRFNWRFDTCHGMPWAKHWVFFSAKSPWDKTIQKRDFCIAKKFLQSIPTSHLSYLSYQYLSYVYVILPVDPLFGKPHVSCVIPRHPSILRPARQIQCVKLRKIHNFSFAQVEDVRGLGSMWHGLSGGSGRYRSLMTGESMGIFFEFGRVKRCE